MENMQKYRECFVRGLGLKEEEISSALERASTPEWDSVGHMGLVAEIEDTFGIALQTDEIIELDSYQKGIDILKKHGMEI